MALIERAAAGDDLAFETMVRRHTDAVWRLARANLRDDFAAEEVVQDTFLKAHRALPSFRGESSVRTWLLAICHRILAGGLVAAWLLLLPSTAQATPPPDQGWIVGVAGSSDEARAIPCADDLPASVGDALGSWKAVGATVCFPKRSGAWHVEQDGPCTLQSDVTTGFRLFGDCVLTIDMGHYVKAWAPVGAYYERFTIVWH